MHTAPQSPNTNHQPSTISYHQLILLSLFGRTKPEQFILNRSKSNNQTTPPTIHNHSPTVHDPAASASYGPSPFAPCRHAGRYHSPLLLAAPATNSPSLALLNEKIVSDSEQE
jgi:hypothetical protein